MDLIKEFNKPITRESLDPRSLKELGRVVVELIQLLLIGDVIAVRLVVGGHAAIALRCRHENERSGATISEGEDIREMS